MDEAGTNISNSTETTSTLATTKSTRGARPRRQVALGLTDSRLEETRGAIWNRNVTEAWHFAASKGGETQCSSLRFGFFEHDPAHRGGTCELILKAAFAFSHKRRKS